MRDTHQQHGISYRAQSKAYRLPYRNLMRYNARVAAGQPVLRKRGPRKIEFDFGLILNEIKALPHGPERTAGTGALYRRFRPFISRADLRALAAQVRAEARQSELAAMRRVEWLIPGSVLALDDVHVGYDHDGTKLWHTTGRDLAARYTFPEVLLGTPVCGEELAGWIAGLFERYGPPLVLKRDNGGNLNHPMVKEVLEESGVIPLNSPPAYPPYNGGVERAQDEIRQELAVLVGDRRLPLEHLQTSVLVALHNLNHNERRCIGGRTACQLFASRQERVTFSRKQRKDIYEEITNVQQGIMAETFGCHARVGILAWCHAAETVLERHGILTVSRNDRVPSEHVSSPALSAPLDTHQGASKLLPNFTLKNVPEIHW